jgi:HEAT repeat protein
MMAALSISACGGGTTAAPSKAVARKSKPTEPKKLDIEPVEVKANEFASIDEALTELDRVLAMPDGEERNRAEIRVQNWLALQGEKAAPAVSARASDAQQPLASRITACRILGKLGPQGIDSLLAVATSGDSTQLRRKAIETLGNMRPADPKTISALVALLDDSDALVQWQVIDALGKFGERAKAAASKLGQLRQNHPDEKIRVSAGEALKKVDPRKTLID